MSSDANRAALVAIDGISLSESDQLLALLPKSRAAIDWKPVPVSSGPFTNTQPIWAELMTGESWPVNGCTGYSFPSTSLNTLKVFTERNLKAPIRFEKEDPTHPTILVNIPITTPRHGNRIWLSAGAMPLHTLVAPEGLLAKPCFANYRPRPANDYPTAAASMSGFADSCLKIELNRLECIVDLLENQNFSCIVWRVSMLEHLQHLFGGGVVSCRELITWSRIERFMKEFDHCLSSLINKCSGNVSLISPYSHEPCLNVINLNSALSEAGFLKIDSAPMGGARSATDRMAAAATVKPLYSSNPMFANFEGRLVPGQTHAASPVSGCIYVNSKADFEDGIVSASDIEPLKQRLRDFLDEVFTRRYGKDCTIIETPPEAAGRKLPAFVLNIRGVEFTDVIRRPMDFDIPHVTHGTNGFALMPPEFESDGSSLQPSALGQWLRQR